MCRYVSFFRDAEVVYLMVHIRQKSLPFRLTLERIASIIQHGQKGMSRALPCHYLPPHAYESCYRKILMLTWPETSLETWQDSAFTWVNVDSYATAACRLAHSYKPWILAADLSRFVRDLPPHAKALVNPKMEFRVLVTMNRMRWNKRKLHP